MILGLDIGGTQTDSVLIDNGQVVREHKTPTSGDLLETVRSAIEHTVETLDPAEIHRMVFSTTTAANAILADRLEPTGMIVSAGPGMPPEWFCVGPCYNVVEGCLDHRGFEARPLDKQSVLTAASRIEKAGIRVVGVVGKFSVRNPNHEQQIAGWLENRFSHVALGHHVSGTLNFPRRIATTYLNAALHDLHDRFCSSLFQILSERGLRGARYLLKPEGGTVELERSGMSPARTAQSGPAASVMGALALDGCSGTTLVLDIGGTTTDMAVVINGSPLLAPVGIRLGDHRTLIRSLYTRSIGVGGDSEVEADDDGRFKIGPRRRGAPVGLGGPSPTPTDAMIAMGLLKIGDRSAARQAMEQLGQGKKENPEITAEAVLKSMARAIAEAAHAFVQKINSRPVYTIHEVLQEERVRPDSIVVIGGPAPQLAPYVAKALDLPCRVPTHFAVANAVGAAVARVTTEINLQADTERRSVLVPEANAEQPIDSRFGLEDAIILGRQLLKEQAKAAGAPAEDLDITVAEQQVFNMIRGFSRTGQNIRLKMSVVPGLIPEWRRS